MKKALTLLLLAAMLLTTVAGCGGTQTAGERELVIGISECNSNFDSYTSYGMENVGHMQVYDSLMEFDEDGKLQPSLAESYELTPDGMEYTFFLRQGVMFSNGEELKASDVVFSAKRAIESPQTGSDWAPVDHAEAVDDYTVKIFMKTPSISFLETLAGPFALIHNEKAVTEYGDQYGLSIEAVVGTGAYILKEWSVGEMCYYESNPDYFKGEASIKKVRFRTIADPNSAVISLETGDIDYYFNDLPAISFESISNNDSLTVVSFPGNTLMYTIINHESEIFSDVRMRRALAYGVDLEKMLTIGAEGIGTIVHTPCGPHYNANPGDTEWYPYDVEMAKELVKECGMEGKEVVIKTYSTGAYPKLATALQQDLVNIGLAAEVLLMERSAFIEDVLDKGDYELGICRFGSSTMDMDTMYPHLHSSNIGISGNWSRYSDPEMDSLLEAARGETDPDARVDLYRQACQKYVEDVVEIPFYYENATRAFTTDISTKHLHATAIERVYNFFWTTDAA